MKLQTSKNNFKPIIIVVIALIIIAGTGIYFAISHSRKSDVATQQVTSGNNPASTEQISNGQSIKSNSINGNTKVSGSDQPNKPTTDTTGKQSVEVDIVSINKVESTLQIRVLISAINNSATCALSITDQGGSVVYSDSATTQAQSNTSTCEGFNVPLEQLSNGSNKVTITYTATNASGSASATYVKS